MSRTSGIVLHITSLPGRFGVGDLGPEARAFVDFLAAAGQGIWQVLPLGPTGYGDSPYQALSAFAGNPLLVSPEELATAGWLEAGDLELSTPSPERVDYGAVMGWKPALLHRAFERFHADADEAQRSELDAFCREHASWLDDYTLFTALKARFQGRLWTTWEPAIAGRERAAVARWRSELAEDIAYHEFVQFQFFRQWGALRQYAHGRGVRIMGDVPIFVSHDSADVWAHPEWFHLDASGQPTVVAGAPPDYFSATGQRWGNPLYRWDVLAAEGYGFWVERLRLQLGLLDWVRLDHFRGFAAYWEIPAGHATAEHGHWAPGPGRALFSALESALGRLPLIAEDLGLITPDVVALREELGLPGMAVLQFAFDADEDGYGQSLYLPHNLHRDLAVYTGTHDNDTTRGWWQSAGEQQRHLLRRYLATDGTTIHWDLIRTALASVADMALFPLQDILGLGSEACLNRPGQASGNWTWRCAPGVMTPKLAAHLADLTRLYGRRPV